MPKRIEMALLVPTKSVLKMSPDAAMLFALSRCTHPPPPVPPFLLMQNLTPKDIAGSDIDHEAESLTTDISAIGPKEFN